MTTAWSVRTRLSRIFDVRDGEGRVALSGFAVLLLLVIAAHTVLETARDTLLLTGPGPRALGAVYVAIAVCTLPAAAIAGRAATRFGVRRALTATLAVAVIAPASIFALPVDRATAVTLYVVDGVLASVLVPQFWSLVGGVLTVSQGRRLFGLIAAAGVRGGVLGSGLATAAIVLMPARYLLIVAALLFAAAAAVLTRLRLTARVTRTRAARPAVGAALRTVRDQPFLVRIALVVFLSTSTLLALDYLFKSSVARELPRAAVGPFVARYYFALNLVSLVVQLFVASAVVRAMGVASALLVTPALLLLAAAGAFVSGGAMPAVLALKGIDGSLRHSIHRITGELSYLPVPTAARQRVKPLVDGAVARAAQTATGAALIALGGTSLVSARPFALGVTLLALGWLGVAVTMRRPYLALLRRAIRGVSLGDASGSVDAIDLESAEVLVQRLASEDPLEVLGAMQALWRRGRQGLVPALILLYPDEEVIGRALEMFAQSPRTDWIPLCRRLLDDPRESTRIAAARALARHGWLDPERIADDMGSRVQGYAAVLTALRGSEEDAREHRRVAELLRQPPTSRNAAGLGMLAAIADALPSRRLGPLLLELASRVEPSHEATELLAHACARQGETGLIPQLIALLAVRAGREAVRAALVDLGDAALVSVWQALGDAALPRRLRMHLPKTLARFGTRKACECLLSSVETEADGLVRYKSIRALEVLVTRYDVRADRLRVERLAQSNLIDHVRLLGLRCALQPAAARPAGRAPPSPVERLTLGLLDDKLRQSLERTFQLLKVAHPTEDIHRVYLACRSDDAYTRAAAAEFLDALLVRRDQQSMRALLRLVLDDVTEAERVSRLGALLPATAAALTRDEALTALADNADPMLAALARRYAREVGSESVRQAVGEGAGRTDGERGPAALFQAAVEDGGAGV